MQSGLPLERIENFIAIGGDARFAAQYIGKPSAPGGPMLIERGPFDKLVRRC